MIANNFINLSQTKLNKIVKEFKLKGYAKLDKIISDKFRKILLQRTNDLMMGKIRYKNMFFKLDDPQGNYFNIKHKDVKNELFSGPSNRYKKIKDLEYDPLFLKLIQQNSQGNHIHGKLSFHQIPLFFLLGHNLRSPARQVQPPKLLY